MSQYTPEAYSPTSTIPGAPKKKRFRRDETRAHFDLVYTKTGNSVMVKIFDYDVLRENEFSDDSCKGFHDFLHTEYHGVIDNALPVFYTEEQRAQYFSGDVPHTPHNRDVVPACTWEGDNMSIDDAINDENIDDLAYADDVNPPIPSHNDKDAQ